MFNILHSSSLLHSSTAPHPQQMTLLEKINTLSHQDLHQHSNLKLLWTEMNCPRSLLSKVDPPPVDWIPFPSRLLQLSPPPPHQLFLPPRASSSGYTLAIVVLIFKTKNYSPSAPFPRSIRATVPLLCSPLELTPLSCRYLHPHFFPNHSLLSPPSIWLSHSPLNHSPNLMANSFVTCSNCQQQVTLSFKHFLS